VITDTNRPWWVLISASTVLGLVVLDETVVGVALPTIRTDLGMSNLASHWVVNAYLLTFTCFLAMGGRLGDLLGRRLVFPTGACVFALGSVFAGAAPSGGWVIAGRALQGLGAAVTFPASMAIVASAFPPQRRGMAFGVQSTIAACFMAAGPLVGGFFSELASWRWIFIINVPIVALTAGIQLALLPSEGQGSRRTRRRALAGFDYPGLLALVVGLTAITVALMQATDWGWGSLRVLTALLGGAALLGVFVAIELRRSQPLVELNLLAVPPFAGGNVVFAMFQFEKMVVFVFMALYLQRSMGMGPIQAGLVVSVAILPTLVTARLAGAVRDAHRAAAPITVALVLTAATLAVMGWGTAVGGEVLLVVVLIIWGAVMPFMAVIARPAVMGAVSAEKQGQASGVNLSIQMMGGTLAIALCTPLLFLTGAYWPVFVLTGALTLATAVVSWRLMERPSRRVVPTG
jgi:EmrB/QacA subfamily drug resistance transporter